MPRPTFLVIGAMKCGTSSLWAYLRSHPDVFLPERKELDFFVDELRDGRTMADYLAEFAPARDAVAFGEVSPNYTKAPLYAGVPRRVADALGDELRLVYIVRDPVERIRSHYLHALSAGWEHRSFEKALGAMPHYVEVSSYAFQVEQWLEHFPPTQLLVVTAEGLRDDRAATLAAVCEFIGVDPSRIPDSDEQVHHVTATKPPGRRPIARRLRAMPGARYARRVVPLPLRHVYGRLTDLPIDRSATTLSDEAEAWLRVGIERDTERFRALAAANPHWRVA